MSSVPQAPLPEGDDGEPLPVIPEEPEPVEVGDEPDVEIAGERVDVTLRPRLPRSRLLWHPRERLWNIFSSDLPFNGLLVVLVINLSRWS